MNKHKTKKATVTALKIVVSLTLLAILFYNCDWSTIAANIGNLSGVMIAAVLFILLLSSVTGGYKWKLLLPSQPIGNLIKAMHIGWFCGTVLPGQIFGEAAKLIEITSSSKGKDVDVVASSIVIDKITGLIGVILVGFVGLLLSSIALPSILIVSFLIAVAAALCLLLVVHIPTVDMLIVRFFTFLIGKITRGRRVFEKLLSMYEIYTIHSKDTKNLLISVVLGMFYQLLAVLIYFLFSDSLGIVVSLADWCWIATILSMALLLPVTVAGLGLREGTLFGILSFFSVDKNAILSLSVLLFAQRLVPALLGGVLILIKAKRRAHPEELNKGAQS